MKIRMFQVDAFTDRVFSGNPAAICPLEAWLPEARMQAIAGENNLSETAFLVKESDGTYRLRWFTPTTEVDLCGHATLASAYVLWHRLGEPATTLRFETRSGILTVEQMDGRIAMRFPQIAVEACPRPPADLASGLGATPQEVWAYGADRNHGNYLAIFGTEAEVRGLDPEPRTLKRLGGMGVSASAPGTEVDFVSRFFAPSFGIDEDPVTGSIHSALAPFWGARLGEKRLHARQVSARSGEVFCELREDGVVIAGQAVCYMEAAIEA